jgi:histidinol-phosphate aminotransferase
MESEPVTEADFLSLATPGVQRLQPYEPGKPLDELEREYGIRNAVKLASNENPLGPSPQVVATLQALLPELARYPDGNGFALKQVLARKHGVDLAQITLGNGSNDILELVTRAFVTPEHEVIFSEHAFAVYPIVTRAVGAQAVVTPAKRYGHDLEAMAAAVSAQTRLIFIANPNNPTGSYLDTNALQGFLQQIPSDVLVVLDEAYFEYARDPALGAVDYPDGSQWLDRFPNLVVTRTFSKAWGLAGLRIGYSLSRPQIADVLNRVRQPFNVNSLALAAAETALADTAHLQAGLAATAQGMQAYIKACAELGLDYLPSVGNFICIKVGDGLQVYEALLREGVIVRPVANYGMPEYLRISIGTAEENTRCIAALKKVLAR